MCVSAAKSFDPRVRINFGGQQITGSDSMRILGVTLDRDCTFTSHMESVAKRLRRKTWALSKLRQKGMKTTYLIEAYKSTIRPTAEYASPAWYPLITVTQSEHLERQQTQALKNIFGVGLRANKMRRKAGLERLWQRRENSCLFFARKNLQNPRCAGWFKERESNHSMQGGLERHIILIKNLTRGLTDIEIPPLTMHGDY